MGYIWIFGSGKWLKILRQVEAYIIFKAMKHVQPVHAYFLMLLLASTHNVLLLGINTAFLGCLDHYTE
jgi:hypothetical protein